MKERQKIIEKEESGQQIKEGMQNIKNRGTFIASQFTTSVSSILGAAKEKA